MNTSPINSLSLSNAKVQIVFLSTVFLLFFLTGCSSPNAPAALSTAPVQSETGIESSSSLPPQDNLPLPIVSVPSAPICEAKDAGRCYYVSNKPGSGAGTFDDPYGLGDLPKPDTNYCQLSSVAIQKLEPGDFLYFRGGEYSFQTCEGDDVWDTGYLRPHKSGTVSAPITFSSYPGESAVFRKLSGGQPLVGTNAWGGPRDFIRIVGFTIHGGISIWGRNNEVAYNEIIGVYKNTGDNYNGILFHGTKQGWAHHNIVTGFTGNSHNSSGFKMYSATDSIVEDNYIHGNYSGIYDKEAGIRNTYRRNLVTGNSHHQFIGNNQKLRAKFLIYDNVVDGMIDLTYMNDGSEIHDNLVRGKRLSGAWDGDTWNIKIYNNVVVTSAADIVAYGDGRTIIEGTAAGRPLEYMDFNFYSAPVTYSFAYYTSGEQSFDLSEMRARGYENNSVVLGVNELLMNQITYEVQPKYRNSGRFGDAPGPENTSEVLDVKRYGPKARTISL